MKRRTVGIVALLVGFVPALALATSPRRVLDQEQPNADTGIGGLAIGGTSEQMLAQTVTVGRTGALTEVRLPIACSTGSAVVEIQGVDASGKPDGVTLATRRVPGSLLPSTFPPAFQTFRFGSKLFFKAGQRFAIVLRVNKLPKSCGVFQGPTGDPYAAGELFYDARPNPPGWLPAGGGRDLPFETLMLEAP
jgi:hypothetical protein